MGNFLQISLDYLGIFVDATGSDGGTFVGSKGSAG